MGSNATSLSVIRTRIHEICNEDPESGTIIPGDIEDEDRPSTRIIRQQAFAGREEVIYRDSQKHMAWLDKEVIPMLLPIQKKTKYGIMGILAGHHWTQLSPVLNSVQYICMELSRLSGKKVPYLGQMLAYLELRFQCGVKTFNRKGLIVHGEGGGQTKASTIQKLERLAQGFEFDFVYRGHDCQLVATKTDRLTLRDVRNIDAPPHMDSRTIAMLNLGAATKSYEMDLQNTSYPELGLMRPATLGWGSIHFKFRRAYEWEDQNHNIRGNMRIEI